ncbi:hypothetical protein OIV83_001041 [Microbotryomycetes sp. JL201]|nr:hypothetical protein OIV83_001041 [Microbotryomycetes sp. JL201]
MLVRSPLMLLLLVAAGACAAPAPSATLSSVAASASASASKPRTPPVDIGFYNATAGGGSFLTLARNTGGLGEPLNVVISNTSDPLLMTDAGFIDYMWSVQMSEEFLGQSLGARQAANLGDGNGQLNQTGILRYNFYDIYYGTIRESINGGSHVRFWRQNGSLADTGAWFLAVSVEMSAAENHMIVPNGYDMGRDELVGNATLSNGTISPITNRTFTTEATFLPGYLPANSSRGINHGIPTDGRIAMLTVKVTSNGSAATVSASGPSSAATIHLPRVAASQAALLAIACVIGISLLI